MTKEQIKKKYKLKLKNLNKHNELYYDKSQPVITDAEYDVLKNEIIDLEKKYSFLRNKNLKNLQVGFRPSKSFEKYKHKVPMLSLSNAYKEEDLKNFEKKIINYLNEKIKIDYSVEPKIDGISASLTYINKKLKF